jgi:phosphatidyl-myo-inositol dimannoside synthase
MNNCMPKYPYIVTLEYPPERGGVGRYLHSLASVSKGELHVVVPMGRAMATEDSNVNTVQMFRDSWPRWWPIVSVCRKLKDKASCILVSHVLPVGTAAMISKWFGGPSYALLFHGLDARLIRASSWKTFLSKLIIRSASGIFVNSIASQKEVSPLVPSSMSIHVATPGAMSFLLLSRHDARLRLGIDEGESVILAVARLVNRKGVDMLIKAASHLPPADRIRIVIIGSGPEEMDLRKLAVDSPHLIQILTHASDEHLAEWYSAADVFCLPIKDDPKDWEGFGIVFLEASLAGLPIVAGRAGGVEEAVIDRETGLIVNGSDPKEIARALVMLLGDDMQRKRLGEAGRMRVMKDFRWEDRWKLFKEFFDSIV